MGRDKGQESMGAREHGSKNPAAASRPAPIVHCPLSIVHSYHFFLPNTSVAS